jgi:hypothetical protein
VEGSSGFGTASIASWAFPVCLRGFEARSESSEVADAAGIVGYAELGRYGKTKETTKTKKKKLDLAGF